MRTPDERAAALRAAFCPGAPVTILCHRLKKRMESGEQSDG